MSVQHNPSFSVICDGTKIVQTVCRKALAGENASRLVVQIALDDAKDRLLAARRNGKTPGYTNAITKQRQAWSWHRQAGNDTEGAYSQLVFLSVIVYSLIATAATETTTPLSQTAIATDPLIYQEVMRCVIADDEVRFDAPFPYRMAEMRAAFEAHEKKDGTTR